jgi:hypothetical protein
MSFWGSCQGFVRLRQLKDKKPHNEIFRKKGAASDTLWSFCVARFETGGVSTVNAFYPSRHGKIVGRLQLIVPSTRDLLPNKDEYGCDDCQFRQERDWIERS